MGIDIGTSLCYGTFQNEWEATVVKSQDVEVEITRAEWAAGVISMSEIQPYAYEWQIKIVDLLEDRATADIIDTDATSSHTEAEQYDLFIDQSTTCTYEYPFETSHRYILVQRGAKFVSTAPVPPMSDHNRAIAASIEKMKDLFG